MKRTVFAAYKQLYQALDLYEEKKLQVYGYLISAARDGGASPSAAPAGGGSGNLRNPYVPFTVRSPTAPERGVGSKASGRSACRHNSSHLSNLSLSTHNRNGPPFGGPFLFCFFVPGETRTCHFCRRPPIP